MWECDNRRSVMGRVHSVETFGTVDGPGVRYVVFLQGCPLRCLYCHNPDTWDVNGGTTMSVGALLEDYERYAPYLRNGGLTITGGEPLLQMDFVTAAFRKAKSRGIHTCLDTSGMVGGMEDEEKWGGIRGLLPYTDLVMLDVKHIDEERHRKLTGRSNREVLSFARQLDEWGASMWIRHVVVPGITDYEEYLEALGEFVGSLKGVKALDVLPYHSMGRKKYKALGLSYALQGVPELTREEAVKARQTMLRGFGRSREKYAVQACN